MFYMRCTCRKRIVWVLLYFRVSFSYYFDLIFSQNTLRFRVCEREFRCGQIVTTMNQDSTIFVQEVVLLLVIGNGGNVVSVQILKASTVDRPLWTEKDRFLQSILEDQYKFLDTIPKFRLVPSETRLTQKMSILFRMNVLTLFCISSVYVSSLLLADSKDITVTFSHPKL